METTGTVPTSPGRAGAFPAASPGVAALSRSRGWVAAGSKASRGQGQAAKSLGLVYDITQALEQLAGHAACATCPIPMECGGDTRGLHGAR